MEGIPTNSSTRGRGIAFDDLSVANSAEIVFLFVFFLNDDIAPGYLYFDIFQKIRDFVLMNTAVCDNIPKFFVIIGMPEE